MTPPRRRLWRRLLVDFGLIGATAFGGGAATLLAMRRLCVQKRGWLTEEQYVDSFVLSRLSPGINILAQVILIGRRVGGWAGSVAAVAGLMLPSIAITVLLCLAYVAVQHLPETAGPLAGLSAAVAGLTIVLCAALARGVVDRRSWGRDAVLLGVFAAAAIGGLHPVVVILGSVALGASFPGLLGTRSPPEADTDAP